MKVHISTVGGPGGDESGAGRVERWEEHSQARGSSEVGYRETASTVELELEVPGARPEGIEVSFKGRTLTVRYEKVEQSSASGGDLRRSETRREVRTREVEVPVEVDPTNADAVLKGGVLRIAVARKGAGAGTVRVRS